MKNPIDAKELLSAAKTALAEGENFRAYDLAAKIPDTGGAPSPQKIHVMALALARSGSPRRAQELVALLPDSSDTEIVGLKSRIFKDMAIAASNPAEKKELFRTAAQLSGDIFSQKGVWYNGINAASCLFMAGCRDEAKDLVRRRVLPRCLAETNHDFWPEATLGECRLLLGEFPEAASHYASAVAEASSAGRFGDLASTLRQLRMLIAEIGGCARPVWDSLALPGIAVFSGHMIDRAERPVPRFPPSAEESVRASLRKAIDEKMIRIGFSSCACGGDILFMEEILASGGECTVVPPLPLETTIRNSVAFAPGEWTARLDAIRVHPKVRFLAPECDETGEDDAIVYDFTNRYLLGLAVMKARTLGFPLSGICVWDGKESGLVGGTDSAVRLWREHNLPTTVVTPEVGQ